MEQDIYQQGHIIVVENGKPSAPKIEDIYEAIDQLPEQDRTALVEYLTANKPGLNLVLGNQQLRGDIVIQINAATDAQLAQILKVVAGRLNIQE